MPEPSTGWGLTQVNADSGSVIESWPDVAAFESWPDVAAFESLSEEPAMILTPEIRVAGVIRCWRRRLWDGG